MSRFATQRAKAPKGIPPPIPPIHSAIEAYVWGMYRALEGMAVMVREVFLETPFET